MALTLLGTTTPHTVVLATHVLLMASLAALFTPAWTLDPGRC